MPFFDDHARGVVIARAAAARVATPNTNYAIGT